mgnify:CR=1 FL=1
MKPNAHLIAIPITSVGVHGGFRSNSWYKHRLGIFRNHTLKSLANQSDKNFLLWLWFRPEEKDNPITAEWLKAVEDVGLKYVASFNGLLYVDDKFLSYGLKTKLRNLGQMLWDGWIYKEWKSPRELWKYTWENKNQTLPQRLSLALGELKEAIGTDFEWVYLTRIDSDDMFHREAAACIQVVQPGWKKALVFDKGYIYNVMTGQVAEWNPPTNPPFHTIIFPARTFFDPQAHREYYGSFTSHEDIRKVFECEVLDVGKYMVSFHGKHISTAWHSDVLRKAKHVMQYGKADPFRGEEIPAKGYCYTTSGRNISTRWQSHLRREKNVMIGKEFEQEKDREKILAEFGLG